MTLSLKNLRVKETEQQSTYVLLPVFSPIIPRTLQLRVNATAKSFTKDREIRALAMTPYSTMSPLEKPLQKLNYQRRTK